MSLTSPYTLLYIALLAVPVVLLHRALRRRPRVGPAVLGVLGVGGAGLVLAFAGFLVVSSTRYGGSLFLVLGLFAWAVFLHTPLALFASAHALWSEHRRAAWLALVTGLGCVGVYGFAYHVEPYRLEVTRHRVTSDEVTRRHRIVLVADVQTDEAGSFERKALAAALAEAPDLLLFAGDYVQRHRLEPYERELTRLNALFHELELGAPAGIVGVEGNCERESWPRVFEGLGAEAVPETRTTRHGELSVTALSFRDGFDPALAVPDAGGFHIVLSHAPDYALGAIEADLLLAGHTHGGQVQIPWFGPPITLSQVPRAWAAGRTDLPGDRSLIVSRGLGMERGYAPRLRFLCRPEIVVIDVVPTSASDPSSAR